MVVDPRFKLRVFESEERWAKPMNATLVLMTPSVTTVATTSPATAASTATPRSSVWDRLETAKATEAVTTTAASDHDALQQELRLYLSTPTISHADCPLAW